MQDFVANQLVFRDLSEAIVFDSQMRVLARASNNVSIGTDGVARGDFERALAGDVGIITGPGAERDRVRAVIKLSKFFDAYLYVSRLVDPKVLNHYYETQKAVSEYRQLENERSATQLRFNIVLVLMSLAILLAAIVAGFWFATRLVRPLGQLLNAAERVRHGDLTARVPLRGAIDEIGVLARAFNRMTGQLQSQTNELVAANRQLDQRRRFTEAVLGGVSAGVLGLDAQGRINLPNRSACALLHMSADMLIGRPLGELVPEMASLLDMAQDDPQGHAEGQVNLEREGKFLNLLAQVRAERADGALAGYVVTFDDITAQLADQRRAAWADVARRIAHEIKNPLTPIQLSAERLRRKYAREVASDPAVFEQCTDTIIRQVGDLRRMVDEFSSFARMPAPIFHREDVVDVVRQAVFLLEVSYPDIKFDLHAPPRRVEMVCDRRLIAQAVTNLVKNAAESIEQQRQERSGEDYRGAIAVNVTGSRRQVRIVIED
ncbi:MAG: HAMP domain-containing protein, partial [Alphaproteobacteria bacterium]